MPPSRARDVLIKCVIAAFALACTVVVAEGALRLALPRSHRFLVQLPHLREVLRPSSLYVRGVHDTARFETNSFGIRGPEFGPDAREYRILAIGGSTTEGLLLDQARAWPAVLGDVLGTTRDGRKVWVGNIGKSGLTSRDHVAELKYFVPQLPRMDLFVVLVGMNDLTSDLRQGFDWKQPPPITDSAEQWLRISHSFAAAPGPIWRPVTHALLAEHAPWYKATALWQLAARVRFQVQHAGSEQDVTGRNLVAWRSHRRDTPRMYDSLPDLGPALADYRRTLNVLADEAARLKVPLVLVTQPAVWGPDLAAATVRTLWMGGTDDFQDHPGESYFAVPALARALDGYNRVVLDVCRDRGLTCVDLAAAMSRDTSLFYDDAHFDEAGARRAADVVAAALVRADPALRPLDAVHDRAR